MHAALTRASLRDICINAAARVAPQDTAETYWQLALVSVQWDASGHGCIFSARPGTGRGFRCVPSCIYLSLYTLR